MQTNIDVLKPHNIVDLLYSKLTKPHTTKGTLYVQTSHQMYLNSPIGTLSNLWITGIINYAHRQIQTYRKLF